MRTCTHRERERKPRREASAKAQLERILKVKRKNTVEPSRVDKRVEI